MKQLALNWFLYGGGTLIASAAARALPKPKLMGNRFYLWFYRFAHYVMANPDKAKAAGKLK